MPRIPHSLLLKAYNKAPFLPLVLRGSRALPLAINELRWLIEYVLETSHQKGPKAEYKQLLHLCKRRSKGEPLQYILGSQPFGNLDIKCRPGVLIPRPETEAYTSYLGHLISSHRLNRLLLGRLRHGNDPAGYSGKRAPALIGILDLCTGSGCIPILLNSLLSEYPGRIKIYGWDISEESIALSKANWAHNVRLGQVKENPQKPVSFEVVNIFDHETKLLDILAKQSHRRLENAKVDIIVSNPPYISQESFRTETTRSVRNWEPKLALVPENLHPETMAMGCAAADIFYQRLLYLFSLFRARVLLMEVGDEAQAVRVAQMALSSSRIRRTTKGRNVVEIWRDSPDTGKLVELKIGGDKVSVRGSGGLRAVVLFKFFGSLGNKRRLRKKA